MRIVRRADADRLCRGITRLSEQTTDKDTWCQAAGALLGQAVPYDGSCWHTIDPATRLITSHRTENLPSRFPLLAANEYLTEDVNEFADLAAAPVPAGVLSHATGWRPDANPRWRGLLRPNGFDAELRVSFADKGACWGSLILVRDRGRPDFTAAHAALIAQVAATIAAGLRRVVVAGEADRAAHITSRATQEAAVHAASAPDASSVAGTPGLVVLDAAGAIDSLTPVAQHWLTELGGDPLPPTVPATASVTRNRGPLSSRARTTIGQWLVLHAARLV